MAHPTWKDTEEEMECRFANENLELWGTEQEFAIRVKDGFLKVATTKPADRDVWMVLLNVLRDVEGRKLITLQATAEGSGHKHRQDVDNRMQRYRAAGNSVTGVLAPWIERPWVLTPEVKAAIEDLGVRNLRATGEEIREALERDFPKLVNAIGSPHIPMTTNAAELVIRQFAMHYQTMAGFETFEGARLQLRLFALVYRFSPFTEKARSSWRGKCPLEIAGYEVQDFPLYKMLRRPLATNIIELAVGRQDSLPLEASA